MHFDSLFSLLLILKRLGVKNLFSFSTISVPLSQRCIVLKKTLCVFFSFCKCESIYNLLH